MLNTPYPYLQASGNHLVDMLETLIDMYANAAAIIGAVLLIVLVWLCLSELQRSSIAKRAGGSLAKRPPAPRRLGERRWLEESST
ncbi:MAG: hypothetical protein ACJ74G_01330 [Blastocatellia bacterium]